eukprot:4690589-Heterocapsa_arctica.AAC.1
MDLQQDEDEIPEGFSGVCEHPGKRTYRPQQRTATNRRKKNKIKEQHDKKTEENMKNHTDHLLKEIQP